MQRAFVIQLSPEFDLGPSKFAGRVEHVDSGRAEGFRSVEELVRFIEQTVKETEMRAQKEIEESDSGN